MAATESPHSPITPPVEERAENLSPMVQTPGVTEGINLTDLNDSRADLLNRIRSLKKDLQDWRGKLDTQVKTYRQELGELKNTLNVEVEQLKSEFQDLRNSLRKQLDASSNIASLIPDIPKKMEEVDS
eukprot:Gb_20171 [translate_table: standard]